MLAGLFPHPAGGQPGAALPLPRPPTGPPASAQTAYLEVTPQSGGTLALGAVSLEVPPGAVDRAVRLSITRLLAPSPLHPGLANATAGGGAYRLEPRGQRFAVPVRVSLPFDTELCESESALSNLFTYFYDELQRRWERLPRAALDRERFLVISQTTHFTDLINATLELPEGPAPILFDVNSIKSLRAADPSEGVPMPEGLEPGPFGAASFRIPLRLPPGRGGAWPALALSYSSDRPNSWLGRGFDIAIPEVGTDTRFGLPRYDETDTYLLEGEELVFAGSDGWAEVYRARTEKSFRRIRRFRGQGEDRWEATSKSGEVREYGGGEGWLGPDRERRERAYRWYLSKLRDAFGNTVQYDYLYDPEGRCTYLREIRWAGFESEGRSEPGLFRATFELEERPDRRSDSRGCFLSTLARRLRRVDVYFAAQRMRSFLFEYGLNEFGQSVLVRFSEVDGEGTPFYTYSFDYHGLTERRNDAGELEGYEGFEAEESWPAVYSSEFKGLYDTRTTSAGGSLYTGVEVFVWIPFIGKCCVASFGVSGGLNFASSATRGALVDINGDGLPDCAWQEGGALAGYLNRGGGFDVSSVFRLPGLDDRLDRESQSTFCFGISGGLGPLHGGISAQRSWTESKTAFIDLNGDGYIDFLQAGRGSFARNSGSELVSTPWQMEQGETAAPAAGLPSGIDDAEQQQIYYLQQPLRRWKAYRSGAVEVSQVGRLLRPASASQDGLALRTHGAAEPGALVLDPTNPSATGSSWHSVRAGDSIYFHMDTGAQEQGDEAEWNVRLRYTEVDFFEDLQQGALFQPVENTVGVPPYGGDSRLQPIYNRSTQTIDRAPVTLYSLRPGWQSLDQGVVEQACEALVEHCAFVPRRLSREAMEKLYAATLPFRDETLAVPDPGNPGSSTSITLPRLLLEGYGYIAEKRSFRRLNAYADEVAKRFLPALSLEERREAALIPWLDGSLVSPRQEAGGQSYTTETPALAMEAALLAEAGPPGCSVPEAGVLLDALWERPEDPEPAERLWLRRGPQGDWRLYRAAAEGEFEQSLLTAGVDPLEVVYNDLGVERGFRLSGKTSLLARLPPASYEGPVSEWVLRGESFRAEGCSPIPEATWAALLASCPGEEQAVLTSSYVLSGQEYRLAEGLSAETLAQVLRILDGAAALPGSIFAVLPGDPSSARRLILLSEQELARLAAGSDAEIAGLFAWLTDAQGRSYYPLPDLDPEAQARLLAAMREYRRDVELFPYYQREQAGGQWLLKTGLTAAEKARIEEVLLGCGLEAWTGFQRRLSYRAGSQLPVGLGLLPQGAREEHWAPSGSLSVEPGTETGVVRIPVFDTEGRSVWVQCYVHLFDSGLDFSAEDLMQHPEEYRLGDDQEVFGGGVFGWFYGSWTGFYPWDEALLSAQEPPPASLDGIDPPPYFELMRPNRGDEGTIEIEDGCGEPVSEEAWIGSISAYSEATLDEQFLPATEEREFAAFITGDRLHASRNGGDAYYRIPRDGTSGALGSLAFIRSSRGKATDLSGGVSVSGLGGDLSSCEGESWGYQAMLDLNGDRFPDAVRLADDAGSTSLLVAQGTGQGFAPEQAYCSPFSRLSHYKNKSLGFGASIGSSSGATKLNYLGSGKVYRTTVQEAKAKLAVSVGANGTLASSIQTQGLLDINGDGLPDHLARSGGGEYLVALNTGSAVFDSPVSWGSGIVLSPFGGLAGLPGQTQGLCHSSTGSFGASAGLSIDAGLAGAGASGGFTGTVSQSLTALVDMNGDGLADQVAKDKNESFFRVRFNQGDRFAEAETRLFRPDWGFGDGEVLRGAIASDLSTLAGLLGGLTLPAGCTGPGYEGAPDSSQNRFQGQMNPFVIADVLDYTSGASFNLGANFTFSVIPVPFVALTITAGINGSIASASTTLRLADIDGDGLPDHVAKLPNEDFLRVKRNAGGKAGLLKTIHLPQGGTWELDYERAGNTVALPQCRWVMSRLTRDDGLAVTAPDRGEHRYEECYRYEDGYYDRAERLFYGFGTVTSRYADEAEQVVHYHNRDLHTRGMVRASELQGRQPGSGSFCYRQTEVVVQQRSEGWFSGREVVFPAASSETVRLYEPGSKGHAQRRLGYSYDEYGNICGVEDEGDTSRDGDELYARIEYAQLPGYLKQHPSRLRVGGADGTLLRLREGEYGERGQLLRLHRYENDLQRATFALSWDDYGNLTGVEDPRGHRLGWEYDEVARAFPVVIRSENPRRGDPAYVSKMLWDCRLGRELERIDVNGQRLRHRYDRHGRLAEVWSPYDSGDDPAVRVQHLTSEFPWRTVTQNKLRFDPQDEGALLTLVTADGLGRVAQTAKSAELWDGGVRREGWSCSGALAYDGNGRVSAEGQPAFREGEALPGLTAMRRPTSHSYDALDRRIATLLPDGAWLRVQHAVSEGQAVVRSVDPLGNITERTLDGRGNTVAVNRLDSSGTRLTGARYSYNALGEILEVVDQAGNSTRSSYDLLGRRTSLECPDSGLVEYYYDGAGNLIRRTDPNLRRRGEAIEYIYDGYNRLQGIDYPRSRDVLFSFGSPSASDFGAGRLLERTDESGRVQYRYGRLGEPVQMWRRIERLTPSAPAEEASFAYLYDYLGRMQSITYPDGEEVRYEYDRGGQVSRVSGRHYGRETSYVEKIGYNEFGQRVYMEYGNGVHTTYTYDENRRWMSGFRTEDRFGIVQQSMSYRFDLVGNVLGLSNRAERYETAQNYRYDNLYQLIEVQGTSSYHPYGLSEGTNTYTQQFSYDAIGNLTRKASAAHSNPQLSAGSSLNYLLDYRYYEGKPHQAERIGEMWYRYDANGNMVEEREGGHSSAPFDEAEMWRLGEVRVVNRGFGLTSDAAQAEGTRSRYYIWDEENRLKRSVEAGLSVDYRYGADGQRAVKCSLQGETLYFDAMWQLTTDQPDLRRSKHIYLGTSRIATRLNFAGYPDAGYEELNTYTYHSDHLGSVQLVTDPRGEIYERIEYAPYGEVWIEQQREKQEKIPFRFTGKELDAETGLYYFGARYLDPRTCRWISPDPAMERYLPEAPNFDGARERNVKLLGEGGLFNTVNLSAYHYAMNNPLAYLDPTGAAGLEESAPSSFPVLCYLEHFDRAGYRERGVPTMSDPYSGRQTKTIKVEMKVSAAVLMGRILPVGISETNKENMPGSEVDAIAQMFCNLLDPDLPVAMSAWIQTDSSKKRILNWSLTITMFYIDISLETTGSRPGRWEPVTIESKVLAMRMLMANPDLMYSLLKQTEILNDRNYE
jgi:RHS repeat-associated protein